MISWIVFTIIACWFEICTIFRYILLIVQVLLAGMIKFYTCIWKYSGHFTVSILQGQRSPLIFWYNSFILNWIGITCCTLINDKFIITEDDWSIEKSTTYYHLPRTNLIHTVMQLFEYCLYYTNNWRTQKNQCPELYDVGVFRECELSLNV